MPPLSCQKSPSLRTVRCGRPGSAALPISAVRLYVVAFRSGLAVETHAIPSPIGLDPLGNHPETVAASLQTKRTIRRGRTALNSFGIQTFGTDLQSRFDGRRFIHAVAGQGRSAEKG